MYRKILPSPRHYRDSNGGLWINGEFYMGRPRTPPMPPRIAMTDWLTGQVSVLSHDATGQFLVLAAVDPLWPDVNVYGPYDGPYTNGYRLYLESGCLIAEAAPDFTSAYTLTRRGFDTTVLRITAPAGVVTITPYDL